MYFQGPKDSQVNFIIIFLHVTKIKILKMKDDILNSRLYIHIILEGKAFYILLLSPCQL